MAVPAKQPLSLSKKLMLGFGALVVVGAAVGVTVWRLTAKKDEDTGFTGYARLSFNAPSARRRLTETVDTRLRASFQQVPRRETRVFPPGAWGTFMTNNANGDTVLHWSETNTSNIPGFVRQDTPSSLQGIILYAYVSETVSASDTAACLGSSSRFSFCPPSGDCCMNTIIYENPGCCRRGATPSLASMKSNDCTFDAFSGGQCQSDCDLEPSNNDVREGCKNWYGPPGGPRASQFIDFAEGETAVNQRLGGVVLPFLRDTFKGWAQKGGTYRSVSIQWGRQHIGNVKNWRFKGPGMAVTKEFQRGMTSYSAFSPSEYLRASKGDAVRFSMDYDFQGMIFVFNFTAAPSLSWSPNSVANCYHNTTTSLHHCLNIMQLGRAFTPHASIVRSFKTLLDS